MRKLGKKMVYIVDTIEAYYCACLCDASDCNRFGFSTASLGVQLQYRPNSTTH